MAMENGMTVWALAVPPPPGPGSWVPGRAGLPAAAEAPAWDAPAQSTQKTTSHVSQNINSDWEWRAHLGTTSRRCRPIRSSSCTANQHHHQQQHNIKQRIITVQYKKYAGRLLEKQTLTELATYLVIQLIQMTREKKGTNVSHVTEQSKHH